jgi:hypothetical protein
MAGLKSTQFGDKQSMSKLNRFGRAGQFEPIRLNKISRLWFKGGDYEVEETEDQRALAQVAAERWQRYQSVFVPAENKYIEESLNYDNEGRQAQVQGQAAASAQEGSSAATDENLASLSKVGITPDSGAFQEAIGDNAVASGAIQTDLVTKTGQALQDSKVNRMKNVVAIGNGQASETVAGMSDIAQSSAAQASERGDRRYAEDSSREGAAGAVAGAGARYAIGADKEDS